MIDTPTSASPTPIASAAGILTGAVPAGAIFTFIIFHMGIIEFYF
jgi:hypothetical protein